MTRALFSRLDDPSHHTQAHPGRDLPIFDAIIGMSDLNKRTKAEWATLTIGAIVTGFRGAVAGHAN